MKDHVTNQELSERLKELGIPQKSTVGWQKLKGAWKLNLGGLSESYDWTKAKPVACAAFLAEELGGILPKYIEYGDGPYGENEDGPYNWYWLQITNTDGTWCVDYRSTWPYEVGDKHLILKDRNLVRTWGEALHEVLAKMLIYLKENELI